MKPDWKDAPEWANWLVMDKNGSWCWYPVKPFIESNEYEWNCTGHNDPITPLFKQVEFENWKDTLEQRPESS